MSGLTDRLVGWPGDRIGHHYSDGPTALPVGRVTGLVAAARTDRPPGRLAGRACQAPPPRPLKRARLTSPQRTQGLGQRQRTDPYLVLPDLISFYVILLHDT